MTKKGDENDCSWNFEPEPQLIVEVNPVTDKFELKSGVLERIFTQTGVLEKPVAFVSVAGPYRQGKSFLLNFFIRYFYHKRCSDWLDNWTEPTQGFGVSHKADTCTKGIVVWSKPLMAGDVAVFLVDTQGSFDALQDMQVNTYVLALTTTVSTVTIFNLGNDLARNYLDFLHFATAYGRMAMENAVSTGKSLTFLIRNWQHISSHDYGFSPCYLDSFLEKKDFATIRNALLATFEQIDCFLMPHPGSSVFKQDFNGQPEKIDDDFLENIKQLIPNVINRVQNARKTLRTGAELSDHFIEYFEALTDRESMPQVSTQYSLQVNADNLRAFEMAKQYYNELMESKTEVHVLMNRKLLNESEFATAIQEVKSSSIANLQNMRRIGGNFGIDEYVEALKVYMDKDGSAKIEKHRERLALQSFGVGTVVTGTSLLTGVIIGFEVGLFETAMLACTAVSVGGLVIYGAGLICIFGSQSKEIPPLVNNFFLGSKATIGRVWDYLVAKKDSLVVPNPVPYPNSDDVPESRRNIPSTAPTSEEVETDGSSTMTVNIPNFAANVQKVCCATVQQLREIDLDSVLGIIFIFIFLISIFIYIDCERFMHFDN